LNNIVSINALQVEFGLGFNRCSNLVSKLEDLGIVSKRNGSKPRDILIKDMNEVRKQYNKSYKTI
jgi:S-DNA-T family DNA segregation ATPase FtsK/SpoIIIE